MILIVLTSSCYLYLLLASDLALVRHIHSEVVVYVVVSLGKLVDPLSSARLLPVSPLPSSLRIAIQSMESPVSWISPPGCCVAPLIFL